MLTTTNRIETVELLEKKLAAEATKPESLDRRNLMVVGEKKTLTQHTSFGICVRKNASLKRSQSPVDMIEHRDTYGQARVCSKGHQGNIVDRPCQPSFCWVKF